MLPCSWTISTWTPRRAKCSRAIPGYFVATRLRPVAADYFATDVTALRLTFGKPWDQNFATVQEIEAFGVPAADAVEYAGNALSLRSVTFSADGLAARVARTATDTAMSLYAVFGATYHGDDLAAWVADGGAALRVGAWGAGDETAFAAIDSDDIPAGANYVRFYAVYKDLAGNDKADDHKAVEHDD